MAVIDSFGNSGLPVAHPNDKELIGSDAEILSRKERINLVLSKRTLMRLEVLKQKTEAASLSEVLKNALRVYDALVEEAEQGHDFLVRDRVGNLTKYKLFF